MAPNATPQPNSQQQPPENDNKKYYKGCGCGCLVLILAFIGFTIWGNSMLEAEEAKDLRITYLKQDLERLTTKISEEDMLTSFAKICIDSSIYIEGGKDIKKNNIEYFTRQNDKKLLIILKVEDLKGVEASTRRVFVEALLDCFSYVEDELEIEEYYICVEGNWNTLLVKTPNGSDLGGKYADQKLLLPFYDEYVKDSLPSLE